MRKNYPASLKFKVALSALTGHPIAELCQRYELASSVVHRWKKTLKDRGHELFARGPDKNNARTQNENQLYQRIGELSTELEFLKKVVGD